MGELDPQLEKFLKTKPSLGEGVYLASTAVVVGDVTLGDYSSVWFHAVLRGDINYISVGDRSNIQDLSVLHLENDRPCVVGADVTCGHRAILHGCVIEDAVLIGMGAIILNGAHIGKGAVIGAGAVVKEHTIVEPNTLWVGVPAKQVKVLTQDQYALNKEWAEKYISLAKQHQSPGSSQARG